MGGKRLKTVATIGERCGPRVRSGNDMRIEQVDDQVLLAELVRRRIIIAHENMDPDDVNDPEEMLESLRWDFTVALPEALLELAEEAIGG